MLERRTSLFVFVSIAILMCGSLLFFPAIPQDLNYHNFADQRTLLGIPNFWNVVSNLPFILVSIWGFIKIKPAADIRVFVRLFLFGFLLTGIGSSYYHLAPANNTLVWDRLPMTIAFMAFFAMMIGLHLNLRSGYALLIPLLLIGVISVFYWSYTESQGRGDLRIYAGVQFIPIVLMPLLLVLMPGKSYPLKYFVFLVLAYLSAKIFEYFDRQLYAILPMSGHAIKHCAAALAGVGFCLLVQNYRAKVPLPENFVQKI